MNDHLLKRYSDFLSVKGERFSIVDNHIYKRYNSMIVPFGPITDDYSISHHKAKELLNRLGGILVRYTKGNISTDQIQEWYAIVCREFVSVETLKSKLKIKGEIKRGITNCEVKRIDPQYLSKMGYDIYYNSLLSYRSLDISVSSKEQFIHNISSTTDFDDIIHHWGAFNKNELIAYCSNYIFDDIEASYTTMKLDPKHLHLYPSYALFYEMNKYYLSETKTKYVNAGFRSILHDTNIQNFLIRKFNFKKVYLDLDLYYRPLLGSAVKLAYPFRSLFSRFDGRVNAIMQLERIRRSANE